MGTRMITTADWIANVIDSEDMAIRKRLGLPLTSTGYAYRCIAQDTSTGCAPESDYERGARRWVPQGGGEASVAAD